MNSRLFATTGFLSALLLVAADARADLERRDSARFAYKYEMVALPTAEDLDGNGKKDFTGTGSWFTLGTGDKLGTCSMVITGSQALKADAASVDADGDVWRAMNATAGESGTGYTVETRLKVTESTGSIGALVLNASTGDSSINSWLVFRTGELYWGNGTDRKLMDIDATVWHDYRIVREPGSLFHSVYVDGVLVADDLPNGISASVNRIFLGAANANYKGKAEVMWLRFDKGAYAPPSAADRPKRKASVDFPVKFDLDEGDDRISAEGTTDCWKLGGSGATIARNRTSLSVTTGGKSAYWDTTDAAWKDLVGADTPYTIEFRVKINGTTQSGADRALNVMTGSAGAVGNLFLGTNSVQWCLNTKDAGTFVTLDDSDNSDGWHIFRLAYEGSTRHGFTVWRDGVVLGEQLVDCVNFYKLNGNALGLVRFGKAGGLNDGSWKLDYIRWETGAVWDWKDPPAPLVLVIR